MKQVFRLLAILLAVSSFFSFSAKEKKKKLEPGLYAELKTSKGTIMLWLEFEKAPLTVSSFVGLAEGKIKNTARKEGVPYFDSLKFHRVVPGFVIQGGDPSGNGSGGPGYKFKNEIHPDLKHNSPGILAMANAGPHTNGSQFYITHVATPALDGSYSVFGRVLEGQSVVDAIAQGDLIISIKIIRKGKKAKKFDAAKVFEELRVK